MTTRLYSVHLGQNGRELKLVREGFSWLAFLFAVPWALWHRMWLAALLFAVAQIALGGGLALAGMNEAAQTVASLGLAVLIGYAANDARRDNLAKRGFIFEDVVVAESLDLAERRVLDARPGLTMSLGDARP